MKRNNVEISKELGIDMIEFSAFEFLVYISRLKLIDAGSTALVFLNQETESIIRFPIYSPLNKTLLLLFLYFLERRHRNSKEKIINFRNFFQDLNNEDRYLPTQSPDLILRNRIKYNNDMFADNPEQFLPINTAYTVRGEIVAYSMKYINGFTYDQLMRMHREAKSKLNFEPPKIEYEMTNVLFKIIGDDPYVNTFFGPSITNLVGNRGKDIYIDLSLEEN